MSRAAIILAGGSGTRLWPMSTPEKPKQFHRLFEGRSLLEWTWDRIAAVVDPSAIYVSTNERYRDLVTDQIPVASERILSEPLKRNTAPAVATACAIVAGKLGEDVTIGIFPSDHWVAEPDALQEALESGFDHAASSDALGTVAITPDHPATGYGYLELGDLADAPAGIRTVKRFVEKPSVESAAEMLASGSYAWNGGMFLWHWKTFRDELGRVASPILEIAQSIATSREWEKYESMPSISIDYALMEKAADVFAVTGEFGWSDLGSWNAIANAIPSDENVRTVAADDVFVRTSSGRRVAIVGLDRVAVIETDDGLLVLDLSRSALMSELEAD